MHTLTEEAKELLEYDEREWPKWHGYIGHFGADDMSICIRRSFAAPFEGWNEEVLYIKTNPSNCGVSIQGFKDTGWPIDQTSKISIEDALKRLLAGARKGHRDVATLLADIVPVD